MIKIQNLFYNFATLFSFISIFLLYTYNALVNNVYLNGYVIMIGLFMLLNPIINMYVIKQKKIKNVIYNFIIILISLYTSYLSIKGLLIYNRYRNTDNIDYLNDATNCFGDSFIFIIITLILLIIISFFLKKEQNIKQKDNSSKMIIILILTNVIPFFSDVTLTPMIFTITSLIFCIITLIKVHGNIILTNEMNKYYLILFMLGILSCNLVQSILSIIMLVQLDKFGINT